ncbi:MAG: pyridoxamine 5'-phosphate oxidase family protein [Dehalococcoidia bacterium]
MENARRRTRQDVFEEEREASAEEADRVREEVKAFIRRPSTEVLKYMVTLRRDGRPHGRPVGAFVEGWTVGTISQGEHLKNTHIRNDPRVGYVWTELHPAPGARPRSVWMQGVCEIVDDPDEVASFYQRRVAAGGSPDGHPDEDWTRLLLRTTPTFVRAEGFLEGLKPAVFRDFSS